ncbi:hypothetical protein [Kribbella sp. NPDC000426]|uniref:sunset domain-containing protein n=1 Tax=Kribbella sp. NPDC000426 TaxID=3154255 RepID=UPI00332D1251
MSWLLRHNWLWSLLAFFLGAAITWLLLDRRRPAPALADSQLEEEPVLVGAGVGSKTTATPRPRSAPQTAAPPRPPATPQAPAPPATAAPEAPVQETPQPVFSRVMEAEPTLFDVDMAAPEPQTTVDVPPGRYGEGSADAVPHQGPPDGFTIKGNAQSMLFHTPDSPYYGRTKPEVWFRTEADAERAGFTKYTRRPRKSADPRD